MVMDKLIISRRCEHCHKLHLPPIDPIKSIQWQLEWHAGHHRSECWNVFPVYDIKLLEALWEIILDFYPSKREHITDEHIKRMAKRFPLEKQKLPNHFAQLAQLKKENNGD